jgi:D,D-heptose 1,7-bisphosphate phosphatase
MVDFQALILEPETLNLKPSPAFFFDRDGVVNVSPGAGYVLRQEDFHFNKGIIESLAFLKARGFFLILVTSQQGVGKGLLSQAALDEIHASMQKELAKHGATFDAIYACTHLDGTCTCRKPSPEMILRAAAEHHLDLPQSWLIGDHDRDIIMAVNAGVPHTIRVLGEKPAGVTAEHRITDTAHLPDLLKQVLP